MEVKLLRNLSELTGTVFCQGARFFGGSRRFQKEKSQSKTNRAAQGLYPRTDQNVDRIRDFVRADRRLTVRMIGEELNLSRAVVHQILTNELEMRKICAKMDPKSFRKNKRI